MCLINLNSKMKRLFPPEIIEFTAESYFNKYGRS